MEPMGNDNTLDAEPERPPLADRLEQGEMHALRPAARRSAPCGPSSWACTVKGPSACPGHQGDARRGLHRLPRDRPADGPRVCLYRLRHVRPGLPQRGYQARPERRNRQAEIPHQHRRSAPTARRAPERPPERAGRDQVRTHLHAHRPGARRRTPRVRTSHPAGPDPARRRGPALLSAKRMDPARAGNLPPSDRQHVIRGAFAQHVGRSADGGCLPQRGDPARPVRMPAPARAAAPRGFCARASSSTSSSRSPADTSAGTRSSTPFPR